MISKTTSNDLVVIPVYNEADTIRGVMCELRRHYFGDILIVDDGSTDNSIAAMGQCNSKGLNILRHCTNLGYGASLIDGFDFGIKHGYERLVTIDCDWQHEPAQVPEFLEELEQADIISGSRYLKTFLEDVDAPVDRKEINAKITKKLNEITPYKITDSFCGFKAYRVSALEKLNLTETGYAFPMQFWIQSAKAGLTVKEIPVKRIYRDANRSFGGNLDDPAKRETYYYEVLKRELGTCQSIAW